MTDTPTPAPAPAPPPPLAAVLMSLLQPGGFAVRMDRVTAPDGVTHAVLKVQSGTHAVDCKVPESTITRAPNPEAAVLQFLDGALRSAAMALSDANRKAAADAIVVAKELPPMPPPMNRLRKLT